MGVHISMSSELLCKTTFRPELVVGRWPKNYCRGEMFLDPTSMITVINVA